MISRFDSRIYFRSIGIVNTNTKKNLVIIISVCYSTEMVRKLRTVREIVDSAGGAVSLSLILKVTADAIYKWDRIGIPDRYWPKIIPMAASNAAEMLAANISARTREAAE